MPRDVANKCQLIVFGISIVIIITSLLVLIYWLSNAQFLTSTITSPITPISTAISFLLAGFALLLSNIKDRGVINQNILITLIIGILLISITTLFDYAFGLSIGVDQLFIKQRWLNLDEAISRRMVPITAINFIFVACAFAFVVRKLFGWKLQTLVWFIFFLGMFSFYNYINGADIHLLIVKYTSMSRTSSLLFILLSCGILLLKPDAGLVKIVLQKSTGSYILRYLLPLFLLVPILLNLFENQFESLGIIDPNFGDSFNAAGTFVLLSIAILFITHIIDREEKKLLLAQTVIRQNEMIFHEFTDHVDIVFFKLSPDLNTILYASSAYEKIWGKSIESLYKNSRDWFESIVPEDQTLVYDIFFNELKNKPNVSVEYRIKRPDGTIRNILTRAFQLKDKTNNVFCIIGLAVDMTDVMIQKKNIQLQLDIASIMEQEKAINDAAPKIVKRICKAFAWDLGELWLVDESNQSLRCVNAWHKENLRMMKYNKKSRAYTFKLDVGLPGRVWKEKQPIWIGDYSKRPEFERSVAAGKAKLHSAFGVPILFQNKVFGIMNFFSSHIQKPDAELLNLMKSIGRSIGEFINRAHSNEQIQAISRNDILTGILNRSTLEENLDTILEKEKPSMAAVFSIDIDKFKLINEKFGLDYGDALLKSVTERLIDLNDHEKDNLARLGADRFLIYIKTAKSKDELFEFASKIKHSFEKPFEMHSQKIPLTVSVGIAIYPQDGHNSKSLITHANLTITHAKMKGGNQIEFFSKEFSGIASEKFDMHTDLQSAINKNQFYLNYQPQIDLKSGRICGAEALVRWEHPTKGLLSPAVFIKYAEQMGLIVSLNEHIIRLVFQQIKWGFPKLPVAINISAQQFKDKYRLVEYLESLIEEFRVDPQWIELEITENMLMDNLHHTIAVLGALKDLGFQFAIDDFGTGFSSFNYLNRIPAHKIKIDRSFIDGLPENKANAEIVKSMIALFHSLGKKVVAEGAEVEAEIDFLKQEHCDMVQGYFYYKPMSADDFITLVAASVKDTA